MSRIARTLTTTATVLAAMALPLLTVPAAHATVDDCVQILRNAWYHGWQFEKTCEIAVDNPESALIQLMDLGVDRYTAYRAVQAASA